MKTLKTVLIPILAALCLVAASEGGAAGPYQPVRTAPGVEPWRCRSFPELKGLGLRCLAEARDRAIWFGTDDGVRRYDGVKWAAYSEKHGLHGAPVNALCATRDGSVYAGTELGISRFREGRWRRVFPPQGDPSTGSELALSETKGQALPWPVDRLLEASDGSVWAGTAWGALRLGPEGTTLYTDAGTADALKVLMPGTSVSIVPDEAAPVHPWGIGIGIRVAEGGYLGARRGRIPGVIRAVASGGPGETAGIRVGDRILKVDGQPWRSQEQLLGEEGGPVTLTVEKRGEAQPVDVALVRRMVKGQARELPVFDVCEARDGAIWFGLSGGEILRYHQTLAGPGSAETWHLHTAADGLEVGVSPRIVQTRDGVIWAVSDDRTAGVNRFAGGGWTHFRLSDLGGKDINTSLLETGDGTLWVGGSGALHALQKGAWKVYTPPDTPLPSHRIRLLETSDGALWVAGLEQEAVRIDYRTSRYATFDGLVFQCETPDSTQWFVSQDGGVVSHRGEAWTRYGVEDGLIDFPWRLLLGEDGSVWAAGSHQGVAASARLNPAAPVRERPWSLQTHPRLSHAIAFNAAFRASDGSLWFGANVDFSHERGQLGGVLRFDGRAWTHHTPPKAPEYAYAIGQAPDGTLWFGGNRMHRFDGQTWSEVTEPEGLTSWVQDMDGTGTGDLWVGTRTSGAFQYDGRAWTQHTTDNGLPDNRVEAVLKARGGDVWVATPKALARFDGRIWKSNLLPAPLISNIVNGGLRQSGDGALWVNHAAKSERGFHIWTTRYEPDAIPPETKMAVKVDQVSQPGNIALAWTGVDAWRTTRNEDLLFAWRLDGGGWSPFTPEKNHLFLSLASGEHTFEVKARDNDFNEDPTPAALRFTVIPPVWRQPWFIGMVTLLLGSVILQTGRVVRRDHRLQEEQGQRLEMQQQLMEELRKELQTAHEMQMGLMPKESPQIEGLDIAGRCIPANHVGGDYFQYFHRGGRLSVCMADVTGHAMEAAIPAVLFSGILKSHMDLGGFLQERFERLNRALCGTLMSRTFVCFVMGEIDLGTRVFSLSDSGCPYPYLFRAATGELVELPIDAYPLGVRSDTVYLVAEIQLRAGDRTIFCSDGIAEATNGAGEQFGYERTATVIREACEEGLSAEGTIDRILETVNGFRGESAQADDMTCVVLRVEG